MLTDIHPKLPMRDKAITKDFYLNKLDNLARTNGVKPTRLEQKPWMQKEFSILDPDNNSLTFGQSII